MVCRGCKRFAHEVVQWNAYDDEQRQAIWSRLHGLRDEVVGQWVEIGDPEKFAASCIDLGLEPNEDAANIYSLVRYLVVESVDDVSAYGMRAKKLNALELMQAIDGEVYQRSLAHYERNFKVSA